MSVRREVTASNRWEVRKCGRVRDGKEGGAGEEERERRQRERRDREDKAEGEGDRKGSFLLY